MPSNRQIGQTYEALAAQYLTQQGLIILDRNAHQRIGELDLVCQQGQTLIFVEVKYRRTHQYGSAIQAISRQKQQRWWQAAQSWLQQHNWKEDHWDCRFDLIAIDGTPPQITWLPNVLLDNASC